MRILSLGGNYLGPALKKCGCQVLHTGYGSNANLKVTTPLEVDQLWPALNGFEPDIFCYLDDGNLPLLIDPENLPCPAIYYSIDTFCNPWHVPYSHGFDLTLVAQKDFLPLFEGDHVNSAWFPLFCEPAPNTADFESREIPVAFVGTLGHKNNPARKPFLERFRRLHPILIHQGDYRPIFNRSRIILNQTAFSELNFRCFQAMAAGCALLMENCANGLDDLFEQGVNILPVYPRGDAKAAAAIAAEWLAKPRELADIAQAGARLVTEKHSAARRAMDLLDLAQPLLMHKNVSRKSARIAVRCAFAMLAAELNKPEMAKYRDFYYKLSQA